LHAESSGLATESGEITTGACGALTNSGGMSPKSTVKVDKRG